LSSLLRRSRASENLAESVVRFVVRIVVLLAAVDDGRTQPEEVDAVDDDAAPDSDPRRDVKDVDFGCDNLATRSI
jgi:hypothetical protein